MKKIKLFVFALCAMFAVAMGVSAADLNLQLPEDVSGSDTYTDSQGPVIEGDAGNKNVTVTYKSGSFKEVDPNPAIGRTILAAYPGIKVYAPEGYDYSGVNDDCGPLYYDGTHTGGVCFKQTEDTPNKNDFTAGNKHFLLNYVALKKDFLETAVQKEAVISYYLKFDWDADGTIDQTITIIIDPTNINLEDKEGNELWSHEIYEEEVKEIMTDVYVGLQGAIDTAKGIDTSKYTEESVKALEEAVAAAEAAGKDLTKNNQSAVIALKNAITTAIANLVAKNGSSVTPNDKPVVDPQQKPEEESPNTYDSGLVYMGLALSAIGVSAISVKKLRNN